MIIEQAGTSKTSTKIVNEKASSKHVTLHAGSSDRYPKDYKSLQLQIQTLETQIQEQTKLSKEQIEALQEDRKIRMHEYESTRSKDADTIGKLREKMLHTQNLLHESTRDYLESKYEMRKIERRWMAEKDRLLQQLDHSAKHEDVKEDEIFFVAQEAAVSDEDRKRYEEEIEALEEQVRQQHQLSEMYREQVIKLEDELCKVREQGDVTKDVKKTNLKIKI